MTPRLALIFVLLLAPWSLTAEPRALLVVRMTPQVQESDHSVSWEKSLVQNTVAGVPVVVNIDASGLAIRVTVTPFVRGDDYLLVVQGDVRQTKDSTTRLATSLQSLLVPPGESIVYFPLGRPAHPDTRQMVVLIQVEPRVE